MKHISKHKLIIVIDYERSKVVLFKDKANELIPGIILQFKFRVDMFKISPKFPKIFLTLQVGVTRNAGRSSWAD